MKSSMSDGCCKVCGKKLQHVHLTHCSNECLFTKLQNSTSISGVPIETWNDDDPWV